MSLIFVWIHIYPGDLLTRNRTVGSANVRCVYVLTFLTVLDCLYSVFCLSIYVRDKGDKCNSKIGVAKQQ